MDNISIYIHIPFCVSKCSYCDFCSFVPSGNQMSQNLNALFKEIDFYNKKYKNKQVKTIYIGGGTPSTMPSGFITRILDKTRSSFNIEDSVEITIEANPNSFNTQKAEEYKSAGCNRLSFGLQSDNESLLKIMNRVHNYAQFEQALDCAIKAGIKNINVDIMLGIPTQTKQDVYATLQRILKLPVTHISAYSLICEPNTPLTNAINSGEYVLPTEDETVDMYDFVVETLSKHHFYRYEISNFAKKGFESRHNLNYWDRGEYLGLGLASCSFVDSVHWQNTDNFLSYIKNPLIHLEEEKETIKTAKEETIMLALRTIKGLNIEKFNQKYDTNFEKEYKTQLDKFINEKLIKIENGYLKITNLYISNSIISEFFED